MRARRKVEAVVRVGNEDIESMHSWIFGAKLYYKAVEVEGAAGDTPGVSGSAYHFECRAASGEDVMCSAVDQSVVRIGGE